jgi:hypothetical protein
MIDLLQFFYQIFQAAANSPLGWAASVGLAVFGYSWTTKVANVTPVAAAHINLLQTEKIDRDGAIPFTGWAGFMSGATVPLAPIHVGDRNVMNSVDSYVLISRTLVNTALGNGHGFSDSSDFTRATKAYCSYDARINITGAGGFDHYAAFQAAPTYNSAGTLDNYYGLYSVIDIDAGTVTNSHGVYVADATGAGALTNNYGVYVAALTKGGTLNYAIWTAGSTPSYFGGVVNIAGGIASLGVGAVAPTVHRAVFAAPVVASAGSAHTIDSTGPGRTVATGENNSFVNGYFSNNLLHIDAGQTDAGYRYGVFVTSRVIDANFEGTLAEQMGIGISYGITTGTGTITSAYGLYLSGNIAAGTITNKWGVYQAGATFKNHFDGIVNSASSFQVDNVQVISNRVIDARIDDAISCGDATTDGVIDALRDAAITHGLIAAA